jgi:hypothetical protein
MNRTEEYVRRCVPRDRADKNLKKRQEGRGVPSSSSIFLLMYA